MWVEADRSAACGRCAARAGCGQGALSALLQQGKGRVRALSGERCRHQVVKLGDEVMIEIPDSTLLGGTLWLYGAPLMLGTGLFTVGGFLGRFVGRQCVLPWVVERVCYPSPSERPLSGRLPGMAGASVSL